MKVKNKIKIHLIAAARPNFMKIAPLYHALRKKNWAEPLIVHTGQHYDLNMSDVFFKDLGLPAPDMHLGIGSGSHAEQTGRVMIAYEKVLMETIPDLVVVVGDVNSTMACTLAAAKINYSSSLIQNNQYSPFYKKDLRRPIVAHLEAGLRSFDRSMPEEINRLVTDSLADILWTPSPDGDENLIREGVDRKKINRVGNIMIDALEMLRDKVEKALTYKEFNLQKRKYGVITLHRPSNVDETSVLREICDLLIQISTKIPFVFPIHPRTRERAERNNLIQKLECCENILLLKPQSYNRFMNLIFNCSLAITDSGGIQEETSYLGIPCLTLRPNTERPVTITHGTNRLCTTENLKENFEAILDNHTKSENKIELWDGHTADRVVESIKLKFCINCQLAQATAH